MTKTKKTPAERDVERLMKKHGANQILSCMAIAFRRDAEGDRTAIVEAAFEKLEVHEGKEGGWCGS